LQKRMGLLVCACMMTLGVSGEGIGMIAAKAAQIGEKIPINVTAGSMEHVYNGQPHSHPYFEMNSLLASGDRIEVSVKGEATYVGDAGVNRIDGVTIWHGDAGGETDVTDQYDISLVDGKITIQPSYLLIRANGNTAVYNGNALLPELTGGLTYQIVDGGLIPNDRIVQLTVNGSQTELGESLSIVDLGTLLIQNELGLNTTGNYLVLTEPGRLIVTKPAVPQETVPQETAPQETVPEETATEQAPAPQPDVEPNPVQLPENETVVEPEWNLLPEPISEPTQASVPEPEVVKESKTVSESSTVSESKVVSTQEERKESEEFIKPEEMPDSRQKLIPLSDTKTRIEEEVSNSDSMGDKEDERIWRCFLLILLLLIEELIRNRKNQNRERHKILQEKLNCQAEK